MWIVLLAVAAAAAYWCVSTLLEVRRQAEGRTEEAGESTPAPVDLSPWRQFWSRRFGGCCANSAPEGRPSGSWRRP